ncbi:MAG: GNAT family N-acetyltransferase [Pseudomonadota bacterium]
MLKIIPVASEDYGALAQMLADSALLTSDLEGENKHFFAFVDEDGWRVGVGGFEIYGEDALLRSFLTVSAHRGQGLGAEMLALLLAEARHRGATTVYLFTEGAEGFFKKQGFTPVAKEDAPATLRASAQYRVHCADKAVMLACSLIS